MSLNLPVPDGGTGNYLVKLSSDAHKLEDAAPATMLGHLGLEATAEEINGVCNGNTATAAEITTVCDGVLTGSATWDPASLIDGAQESKDFTVTGAALGDFAIAGAGVDVTDFIVSTVVTAANTVTVTLANETGGTVDLATSTWKILVIKG